MPPVRCSWLMLSADNFEVSLKLLFGLFAFCKYLAGAEKSIFDWKNFLLEGGD